MKLISIKEFLLFNSSLICIILGNKQNTFIVVCLDGRINQLNVAKPFLRKSDLKRRELARQVRKWSISDLLQRFIDTDVWRAFIFYENGVFTLSHAQLLAPLRGFLLDEKKD